MTAPRAVTTFDQGGAFRSHPLIASAHAAGENRNVFEAFVRGFVGDLAPVGTIEATLAARAAGIAWRLNRAQSLETKILSRPDRYDGDTPLDDALENGGPRKALEMVARWEQGLERSLFKTLEALERLQRQRLQRTTSDKIDERPIGKPKVELEILEPRRSAIQFDGENTVYRSSPENDSTP
jgi:hypothetical protein